MVWSYLIFLPVLLFHSTLNNVFSFVAVKKLTNQLPDLFSKIESINQQLMPISNISENVNRIRELIQQARDAANKVCPEQSYLTVVIWTHSSVSVPLSLYK